MAKQSQSSKKQNRSNRKVYLALLLLLGISIGFAALSATLQVVGTTTVKQNKWDIKFGDVTETTELAANGEATVQSSDGEGYKTGDITFTATLNKPGDAYEFTVPVTNAGTIDAKVASLTNTALTADQQKYLIYTVKYGDQVVTITDGTANVVNDVLDTTTNKTKNIVVRVEFKKDLTAADLPTTDTPFQSTLAIEYTQK